MVLLLNYNIFGGYGMLYLELVYILTPPEFVTAVFGDTIYLGCTLCSVLGWYWGREGGGGEL